MSDDPSLSSCWVVSDAGKVGTLNQCTGLAEGLGFIPRIIEIQPKSFWSLLPASLWPFPLSGITPKLTPPWPQLIIAAGRASVSPTARIRQITQGRTKVVQLQNPRIDPALFDAVIAPAHDKLSGPNVITTKGALHRVTMQRVRTDVARFKDIFASLPRPIITVLIGGTNRCYSITPTVMNKLVDSLKAVLSQNGGSLAVTVSRRTEPENLMALKAALTGLPHYLWSGDGDNPYFAMLGIADAIVVTSDSVSMTSEACAMGAPVYVYHLPGGSRKFASFHRSFEEQGLTKPLLSLIDLQDRHLPLFEMDDVLQRLRSLLSLPG
ncbi:MAG: mitochondrial fission ELM1 family protein [Alphaproteobacteria bacterium]|nr:mitochondrial fission ELM1 family protein [Alphaproteobacteria bacterium]